MANTTNLDLVKPLGTDHALISVINGNMDKVDAYAGKVNESLAGVQDGLAIVAVGDTHAAITSGQFVYVKEHNTLPERLYTASADIAANGALSTTNLTADSKGGLNAFSDSLTCIQDGLAIVAVGDTHGAITSGQFVYVKNHSTLQEGLYTASANIAANATLSGSNLTADSTGGLNALSEQIDALNSKITPVYCMSESILFTNGVCNLTFSKDIYVLQINAVADGETIIGFTRINGQTGYRIEAKGTPTRGILCDIYYTENVLNDSSVTIS